LLIVTYYSINHKNKWATTVNDVTNKISLSTLSDTMW